MRNWKKKTGNCGREGELWEKEKLGWKRNKKRIGRRERSIWVEGSDEGLETEGTEGKFGKL